MGRPRKPSPGRHRTTQGPAGLPDALVRTLGTLVGDELPALGQALQEVPPVSIRTHPAKGGAPPGTPVPWCSTGRYLTERPVFTLDPLLHAGAYYVQEASSMLLEQAVIASGMAGQDVLALDLCAAPGGKSTHLRSLLGASALLVANEVDGRRRSILEENLWKWGIPNVVVAGSVASDLHHLPDTFDLVLVDAPCSGEGMFRKDPFARTQWSPGLVSQCAATQRSLLPPAWTALRPGGVLIYSTCTWEAAENEEQLAWAVREGGIPVTLPMDPAWGVVRSDLHGAIGYRCYPHRVKGEGFFIGAVRKPGGPPGRSAGPRPSATHPEVRTWLTNGEHVALHERNGILHMVDGRWEDALNLLIRAMRITAPGIPVAERKGDRWRPHPALALNTLLGRAAFPALELDERSALGYLRGLSLPATEARGTALAMHQGLPLGWLHGAGGRWNNRWPAGWRIRMQ